MLNVERVLECKVNKELWEEELYVVLSYFELTTLWKEEPRPWLCLSFYNSEKFLKSNKGPRSQTCWRNFSLFVSPRGTDGPKEATSKLTWLAETKQNKSN